MRPDFLIKKRGDAPRANRPYALFAEALIATGKAAIGTMVMRSRESLVAITMREDVMILRVVMWADELRAPVFQEPEAPAVVIPEQHRLEALRLVDALTTKFDIDSHVDRRELALSDLIKSRQQPIEPAAPSNVVDLLARLPKPATTEAG